jgi:hypothetical protein
MAVWNGVNMVTFFVVAVLSVTVLVAKALAYD